MYICWAIPGCLQSALFFLDISIAYTCFLNFPFHAFSYIRHPFNYTNHMYTVYIKYISVPYFCYMFQSISHHLQEELTHSLLKTIGFYKLHVSCVIKCKRYNFVGLQYSYNDYRLFKVCNIQNNMPQIFNHCKSTVNQCNQYTTDSSFVKVDGFE